MIIHDYKRSSITSSLFPVSRSLKPSPVCSLFRNVSSISVESVCLGCPPGAWDIMTGLLTDISKPERMQEQTDRQGKGKNKNMTDMLTISVLFTILKRGEEKCQ